MNKLRQWSLLTGVATLGVLALGWFMLVSPQRSHASSLRNQTAQVQQSNQTLANNVAMLRAQARNLPADQAWLDQFASQIPNNPALPSLIRQLSSAADDAGVELASLAPTPPAPFAVGPSTPLRPLTTGAAPAATLAAPHPAAPSAAVINLTITVYGTYFNIEQFLDDIEHMPRAITVGQLSLAPGKPQGASSGTTGSTGTSGSSATGSTGSGNASPSMLLATVEGRVFMTQPAATTSTVLPSGATK